MSTATTHSTTMPANTNVVGFVAADDVIPTISGIPLADCDAKVIARRLRAATWAKRALFFRNVVHDSLENAANLTKAMRDENHIDSASAFLSWALVEMQRKIGETLDLLGVEAPDHPDGAALFCLSLKPAHHNAGRKWIERQYRGAGVLDFFASTYANETFQQLGVFYRMVWLGNPTASMLWEAGPIEWPNLPPPSGDSAMGGAS